MSSEERDDHDDYEAGRALPEDASHADGGTFPSGQQRGSGSIGAGADQVPADEAATHSDPATTRQEVAGRAEERSDGEQEQELIDPESNEREPSDHEDRVEEVAAAVVSAMSSMSSESFSGMLPHPEHWNQYGPEWQERIARMAESYTTDESARRDRVVDGRLKEAGASRRAALLVIFGAFLGAIVTQALFGIAWLSVTFMALPVMQAAREFLSPRQESRRRQEMSSNDATEGD